MPKNTIYVGMPTIWGNPFAFVENYRRRLNGDEDVGPIVVISDATKGYRIGNRNEILRRLPELRGKNLACWCPLDGKCHADVLLEMANT